MARLGLVLALALLLAAPSLAAPSEKAMKKAKKHKTITVNKGDSTEDMIPTTTKGFLRKFHTAEGSAVVELEEGFFKSAIDAYHATIVFFYMPNSKLCDNLRPAYEKAAQILRGREGLLGHREVLLAQVNLNQKRVIAEHFNITHVPHLRVFKNGDIIGERYDGFLGTYSEGMRTAFSVVNFAMRLAGFPLNPLDDEVDLSNLKKIWLRHPQDMTVVSFFDGINNDTEHRPKLDAVIAAGQADKNMTFSVSQSKTLAEKFKVQAPALTLFKNYDERRADFSGEWNEKAISDWIEEHRWPRLVDYDPASRMQHRRIWQGRFSTSLVLFDKEDGGATDAVREACRKMGTRDERGILCLSYPRTHLKAVGAGGIALYYSVVEESLPAVMILHQARNKIEGSKGEDGEELTSMDITSLYKLSGTVDEASVTKFASDFHAGKLEQWYRTQGDGKHNIDRAGVSTLVGSSVVKDLDEMRADNGALLFIDEATISIRCSGARMDKRLCATNFTEAETKFNALGGGLGVALAKIDSYYNDLEHFAPEIVKIFKTDDQLFGVIAEEGPQLVYFPKGDGKPFNIPTPDYMSASVADIKKKIEENGGGGGGGSGEGDLNDEARDEL